LSGIGSAKAASAIRHGVNVQSYSVLNSMAERFSAYTCTRSSLQIFSDVGAGSEIFDTIPDPNFPRHRVLYVVAEGGIGKDALTLCRNRALWEAARRSGRGAAATATVTSWRDGAGKLWTPNTLVETHLPGLREPDPLLVIGSDTYRYDSDGGTVADLNLMPSRAFQREPLALIPVHADVTPIGPKP